MNSSMEKPYVVGIDIGGTNTVFGIVDARGTIIASGSIKTGAHDQADDYVDAVCKNLLPLIIANGGVDKIKGIGIGAPNGNYRICPQLAVERCNTFGSYVRGALGYTYCID